MLRGVAWGVEDGRWQAEVDESWIDLMEQKEAKEKEARPSKKRCLIN